MLLNERAAIMRNEPDIRLHQLIFKQFDFILFTELDRKLNEHPRLMTNKISHSYIEQQIFSMKFCGNFIKRSIQS